MPDSGSDHRGGARSGVWLLEPDPAAKRLDRAKSLLPGRYVRPNSAGDLRDSLRPLRLKAVENMHVLAQVASGAWAAGGLQVHHAEDALAVAAILRGIAGSTCHLAINRSATVSKELAPDLIAAGFELSQTYYLQHQDASILGRAFWQIPELNDGDVIGCYGRPADLTRARRQAADSVGARDVVGVLGVAAVSASDGGLFLLQHTRNVADTFAVSRHVVLVASLDKLVPGPEDALRQTRCMGLFGAEATLLDLPPVKNASLGPQIVSLAPVQAADEVHVILLDNGRTAMRRGEYRELLACIGCRACAVKCPTYRYYSGEQRWCPKEYLFYHLRGKNPSLDLCVGCGMCLAQCPVGIDIPAMMLRAKARRAGGITRFVLSSFEATARMSRISPAMSNAALSNVIVRRIAEPLVGLKAERNLPAFAGGTFAGWFHRHPRSKRSDKVAYYAGCTANYVEPVIGKATVELLERAGLKVLFPDQVCCGMPQMGNGRLRSARANARRNVRALLEAKCDVVTACTSCALAIKHEYVGALRVPRADELAPRVFDVLQYVGQLRAQGRLQAATLRQDVAVLYHAPCHLKVRGAHLVQERVDLISQLPGVTAKTVDRGCCGMAGTFGSKCEGYGLSMQIGSPLFEEVNRADPDVLATDCPTCSMQLAQGTGRKPVHPVVLLWQAYGMAGVDGVSAPTKAENVLV